MRARMDTTARPVSTTTTIGSSRRRAPGRSFMSSSITPTAASTPAMGTSGLDNRPFSDVPPMVSVGLRLLRPLLDLGPGHFYHMGPLLDVFAQIGIELLRRLHQRDSALLEPGGFHVGQFDHLVDRAVEEGDDLLGRALRRHQADPDGRLISGQ